MNATGSNVSLCLGQTILERIFLERLAERHRGLTSAQAATYSEAARVVLDNVIKASNSSNFANFQLERIKGTFGHPAVTRTMSMIWSRPGATEVRAHRDRHRATEEGACGVCLAAVEDEMGYVAYAQAHRPTGADYFLETPEIVEQSIKLSEPNYETAICLEVSGIRMQSSQTVYSRLQEKVDQVKRNKRAIAAVCGFQEMKIGIVLLGL